MMDWHYYKDDKPTEKEQTEYDDIRNWQSAGFSYVSTLDEKLSCGVCGALVLRKAWRKHKEFHGI